MENNIYKSIQEWYDLQKQGIITEKEFQEKKEELLNNTKNQIADSITVENSEKYDDISNIEPNRFFEFVSKYKFYIIFIALAIVMTLSYFKNFYNAEKEDNLNSISSKGIEDLNIHSEIEKWKKELYLNKEVGPECIEDYHKWAVDNPDYYFGMQETKTIESDYNSDDIMDYLVYMPAVNCVGGNGSDSDFALLIYSDGNEILRNKVITKEISALIKIKLSENNIYIDYTNFHYKSFDKTIGGIYYSWIENDAHCCPSYTGTFEYNLENGSITIENKKNE